jgi:CheY-like chemotaxis protein
MSELLIVEDDDDARGALVALLESAGHTVVEARDGAEALAYLRGPNAVSLILLDLWMPVMNGWEFRDAQTKDPVLADLPVVVITADDLARRQAPGFGAVAWLTKPVDFARLLELVDHHA